MPRSGGTWGFGMRALVEAVRASSLPTMDLLSALNNGQSRASGFGAANTESNDYVQGTRSYCSSRLSSLACHQIFALVCHRKEAAWGPVR